MMEYAERESTLGSFIDSDERTERDDVDENWQEETRGCLSDIKNIIISTSDLKTNDDGDSCAQESRDRGSSFQVEPSREHVLQRNKYLSKLAYTGVWKKQQSATKGTRKSTSLTIFDWDDTLFPTSAFSPKT